MVDCGKGPLSTILKVLCKIDGAHITNDIQHLYHQSTAETFINQAHIHSSEVQKCVTILAMTSEAERQTDLPKATCGPEPSLALRFSCIP